jgi:hypothetical protein
MTGTKEGIEGKLGANRSLKKPPHKAAININCHKLLNADEIFGDYLVLAGIFPYFAITVTLIIPSCPPPQKGAFNVQKS